MLSSFEDEVVCDEERSGNIYENWGRRKHTLPAYQSFRAEQIDKRRAGDLLNEADPDFVGFAPVGECNTSVVRLFLTHGAAAYLVCR